MIVTYFGSPGAGKTTLAVKSAIKNQGKYANNFCNFSHTIPGVGVCNFDKLGEWTFPPNSLIQCDESGIEFNSRAYKSLPKPAIAWFKTHRHFRCDLNVYSQSWEDMDIVIRRLSNELWYIQKIGPWTLSRRVYKRVKIDKNTEQIIDGYRMASPIWLLFWFLQLDFWLCPFQSRFKLTFRPFYYKYFNTYNTDNLPIKEFPVVPWQNNGK